MLAPGARVGNYRLLEKLGQGGMGVVFKAQDERLGRLVAVKVASSFLANDEVFRKRFAREARAAAAVQSAHVASILDVGEHEALPYIVLELLPGGSLADAVKRDGPLGWQRAAEYGVQIARALQAVHAAGLVHRDLKPENVLLDASGVCKVTDFGLVGVTDAAGLTVTSRLTESGDVMGTPAFMAPEQADGKKSGPEVDVYALGALIYCLLAGRPPFQGDGLSLLKKILADAPTPLGELAPGVPPELVRVVDRLLAKSPGARGDAAQAATDLAAVAVARSAPPAGRFRIFLALASGLSVVAVGLGLALLARPRDPERGTERPVNAPSGVPRENGAVLPLPPLVCSDPATAASCMSFRDGKNHIFHLVRVLGTFARRSSAGITRIAFSPDGGRVVTAGYDRSVRIFETATGDEVRALHGRPRGGMGVAWAGSRVLSVCDDGAVYVWNPDADGPPATLEGSRARIRAADLAFDGALALTGAEDGGMELVDLVSGRATWRRSLSKAVNEVRFAPDGSLFATAEAGGQIRIWNTSSGVETRGAPIPPLATEVYSLAFSSDGKRLVAAGEDAAIHVFDVASRRLERSLRGHARSVHGLACSPVDARSLASVSYDGTLRTWDLDGGPAGPFVQLGAQALGVAWTPDGKSIATGTDDHLWRLWRLNPETLVEDELRGGGHRNPVLSVHFSSDGKRLLSASSDRTVKLWDDGLEPRTTLTGSGICRGAIFLPDGRRVLAGYEHTGEVRLWDLADGRFEARTGIHRSVKSVASSRDLTRGFTAGSDGDVVAWDLRGDVVFVGSVKLPPRHKDNRPIDEWVDAIGCSATGTRVLTGGIGIGLWDPPETKTSVWGPTDNVHSVSVVQDGRTALAAAADGSVRLWNLSTRGAVDLAHHEGGATLVCASDDGALALTGGDDRRLCLWGLKELAPRDEVSLASSDDVPLCGEFAPDGKSFAVGTARGVILVFELAQGRPANPR